MARRQQATPVDTSPRKATPLQLSTAALTDIGRTRENNEDNFLVFDLGRRTAYPAGEEVVAPSKFPGLLLAVADGMGGHQAGQVASQMCVDTLSAELLKLLPDKPRGVDWEKALRQAVDTTNAILYKAARQNSAYEGMGTTLTAAVLTGREVHVAQVGDSRAYLLRRHSLVQLTQDQTIGNSLRASDPQAQVEKRFEGMLLQAVGALQQLEVVVTRRELEPGDFLLLCSDGLYRIVSASAMTEVLQSSASLEEKVKDLITRANNGGGPDNITVVLCGVHQGGGE